MLTAHLHSSPMESLRRAHGNVARVSSEDVEFDLSTDSLQHRAGVALPFPLSDPSGSCEELITQLFGFPHVILLSQGRLAEALLARACVRPGAIVPSNHAFPTTRIHQELCGGVSVSCTIPESRDADSLYPFKGNVNLVELERACHAHSGNVGYVCVELSANGLGGQPCSLENLRSVRVLTQAHGIPLFLDASRILENSFQLIAAQSDLQQRTVWEIVRETCELADGMTMSLTKDFPTPLGGVVAVRDAAIFERGLDFAMAMGDGLCTATRKTIAEALRHTRENTGYTQRRMALVSRLHAGLAAAGIPVLKPSGAHAVFINVSALVPHLATDEFPADAVNTSLYQCTGIRGSTQAAIPGMPGCAAGLLRLAVPIQGFDAQAIDTIVERMSAWIRSCESIPGLNLVYAPPTPGGVFRAWFETKQSAARPQPFLETHP